jgi:opacity protein-like surface antigen
MLRENGVDIGTKQMRRWWLIGAALSFLAGTASAETSGSYVNADDAVLLPPAVTLAQPDITQIASLESRNVSGTAYGYDLGNGFKTEIQGVTARATNEHLANLPAGGSGIAATSVMLKGMYEFSDGAWRMSPYVGAGFGVVDSNARVLGATSNDWVSAYQLQGGINLGFTQKLMGSLEYRWTMGSKPHFSLAGIPAKLEVNRHGFVVGMNYKY